MPRSEPIDIQITDLNADGAHGVSYGVESITFPSKAEAESFAAGMRHGWNLALNRDPQSPMRR